MSETMHRVLYIGSLRRGDDLQRALNPRGGYVYQPEQLLEALGQYVFYAPHVVVVDLLDDAGMAAEALPHLIEIGAQPLVLIGDSPLAAQVTAHLPLEASLAELLQRLDWLSEQLQQPG